MLKFISYLTFVLVGSDAAKILGVFPAPSISHQVVYRPLMLELAKRGHEVTVITPNPGFPKGQSPQNLTEIDVHDISYKIWNDFIAAKMNDNDRLTLYKLINDLLIDVFVEELKTDEVQAFLHEDRKFDLLFTESFFRPALIFSHIYKVPVIEISSANSYIYSFGYRGASIHPLLYPDIMHRRFYNLTMWEKITELYIHYKSKQIFNEHVHYEDEMLRKLFGSSIPSLNDLVKNIQMLFSNVHPLWDFNRPVPPSVLYLGCMHQNPEKDLPKEWKSVLDSSKHGVIYVSFGTNVKPSMFPADKISIFVKVLSSLQYDVVWKWDKDELPGRTENIKISKWLPQSDLLRHRKIKLFITQGGLQSTDEALNAGVPLIGVPMLGDQWLNVEHYVNFNIGKKIAIESLTEEELLNAIHTVINDKSYRENVVRLRNILRDRPQSSLESAVWWTEYVLRHKNAAHLQAPGAHMSWAEYYELELISFLLASVIIILIISVVILYYLVTKVNKYVNFKVKTN